MKAEAVKEHGTSAHLELPDIVVSHEFTYEAPPGKATADRPMPLPRPMVSHTDEILSIIVKTRIVVKRRSLGKMLTRLSFISLFYLIRTAAVYW